MYIYMFFVCFKCSVCMCSLICTFIDLYLCQYVCSYANVCICILYTFVHDDVFCCGKTPFSSY